MKKHYEIVMLHQAFTPDSRLLVVAVMQEPPASKMAGDL